MITARQKVTICIVCVSELIGFGLEYCIQKKSVIELLFCVDFSRAKSSSQSEIWSFCEEHRRARSTNYVRFYLLFVVSQKLNLSIISIDFFCVYGNKSQWQPKGNHVLYGFKIYIKYHPQHEIMHFFLFISLIKIRTHRLKQWFASSRRINKNS